MEMRGNYNSYQDSDFAAAVAAGTFAIISLEEAKAKYRKQMSGNYNKPTREIQTAKGDTSVAVTKLPSIKDAPAGKNTPMPNRKLSRLASMKPMDQRQKSNVMEDKVDSWEKAQLRKINKRYEKMKAEVVVWEKTKKTQAKLSMERKKKEMEMRKIRNMQHYQIKVDRIEAIAGGAKGQLEDKRRSEEAEVKEKAKHKRSKDKNPVSCFCC